MYSMCIVGVTLGESQSLLIDFEIIDSNKTLVTAALEYAGD